MILSSFFQLMVDSTIQCPSQWYHKDFSRAILKIRMFLLVQTTKLQTVDFSFRSISASAYYSAELKGSIKVMGLNQSAKESRSTGGEMEQRDGLRRQRDRKNFHLMQF